MSAPKDPCIHSHIEDVLPDDHPLAFVTVDCTTCGVTLHHHGNKCMRTWVETGRGNFCVPCFAAIPDVESLDDDFGLP